MDQLKLPLRQVPGDHGLPLLGPIRDRFDFFYFQGPDAFFSTRMKKHNSTVFRTNIPPGPFISSNSRVVVLLDAVSFPTIFDLNKVERTNVLTGTYVPSIAFTGGHRPLAYMDTSEPNHRRIKRLILDHIRSKRERLFPEFQACFSTALDEIEAQLHRSGRCDIKELSEKATFNFLSRVFLGVDPSNTEIGNTGPILIEKWLLPQICPIASIGVPLIFEDILFHTFPLPPFFFKHHYRKLYAFFSTYGEEFLQEAEKIGLTREEACNNLLFLFAFNAYGGLSTFLPLLLKWVGGAGEELHQRVADEVRFVMGSSNRFGELTPAMIEKMPLVKSVIYEALRIQPPVPYQFGRAKRDLVIESHDAAFKVDAGEMIMGYQPFATRDPLIFECADRFVGDRFVGDGAKLVKHVLWSNGFETDDPSEDNKQCAGKDLVILCSRLLLVELFRRYETFEIVTKHGKSAAAKLNFYTSSTRRPSPINIH